MPRNEDGEFELVVGNKQLLSIVFILMVVFGVVFSMGYFVGRANSGSDTPAPGGQQAANQTAGRPQAAGAESGASSAPEATPDAFASAGRCQGDHTDQPRRHAGRFPGAPCAPRRRDPAATPHSRIRPHRPPPPRRRRRRGAALTRGRPTCKWPR